MAQSPATQWPMTNIFNPWPVYTDGVENVIAVKISSILPHTDGSITIVPDGDYNAIDGDYNAIYEPQIFVTIFSPEVGGYLVRDSDNQDLYIPAASFESTYSAVPRGSDGKDGKDAAAWARSTSTGNLTVGYPDDPSASSAHGKFGTTLYWKTTVSCVAAQKGNSVIASANIYHTPGIPCDADGNALPFVIITNQLASATSSPSSSPSVEIYLFVYGAATQLCNLKTKAMKPLTVTSGDGGSEPNYAFEYWYQRAQA